MASIVIIASYADDNTIYQSGNNADITIYNNDVINSLKYQQKNFSTALLIIVWKEVQTIVIWFGANYAKKFK